jgi:hypothetical protein
LLASPPAIGSLAPPTIPIGNWSNIVSFAASGGRPRRRRGAPIDVDGSNPSNTNAIINERKRSSGYEATSAFTIAAASVLERINPSMC